MLYDIHHIECFVNAILRSTVATYPNRGRFREHAWFSQRQPLGAEAKFKQAKWNFK